MKRNNCCQHNPIYVFNCSSHQFDITDEINLCNCKRNSLMTILEGVQEDAPANKQWSFTSKFPFPDTRRLSHVAPPPNMVLQNLLNTPTKSNSSKRTYGVAFAPDPTPKPYPDTSRLLGGLNQWECEDGEIKRRKMMEHDEINLNHRHGIDFHNSLLHQKSPSPLLANDNLHHFENTQRNSLLTILEGDEGEETPTNQAFTNEFPFPDGQHLPPIHPRPDLNLQNLMMTPKKSNSKRINGFDLSPYPTSNSVSRLFGHNQRSTRPPPHYF